MWGFDVQGMIQTLVNRLTSQRAQALDEVTATRMGRLDTSVGSRQASWGATTTHRDRIDAGISTRAPASDTTTLLSRLTSARAQRLDANISSRARYRVQVFTSAGTWSRPAGVDVVYVSGCAGGGGGGGDDVDGGNGGNSQFGSIVLDGGNGGDNFVSGGSGGSGGVAYRPGYLFIPGEDGSGENGEGRSAFSSYGDGGEGWANGYAGGSGASCVAVPEVVAGDVSVSVGAAGSAGDGDAEPGQPGIVIVQWWESE